MKHANDCEACEWVRIERDGAGEPIFPAWCINPIVLASTPRTQVATHRARDHGYPCGHDGAMWEPRDGTKA